MRGRKYGKKDTRVSFPGSHVRWIRRSDVRGWMIEGSDDRGSDDRGSNDRGSDDRGSDGSNERGRMYVVWK